MDEHTVLEHVGNLGFILLAVLLSTAVHYLFKTLEPRCAAGAKVPPDQTRLWLHRLVGRSLHRGHLVRSRL